MSEFKKKPAFGINVLILAPCFIVKDAELKYTSAGVAYTKFSVGYDDSYRNKDGDVVDQVSFFNCSLWGKRAESLVDYIKKGRKADLTGKLVQKSYEVDGNKRNSVEIAINDFNLRPTNKKTEVDAGNAPQKADKDSSQSPQEGFNEPFADDDVPF